MKLHLLLVALAMSLISGGENQVIAQAVPADLPEPWQRDWSEFIRAVEKLDTDSKDEVNRVFAGQTVQWTGTIREIVPPQSGEVSGVVRLTMEPVQYTRKNRSVMTVKSAAVNPTESEWPRWSSLPRGTKVVFRTKLVGDRAVSVVMIIQGMFIVRDEGARLVRIVSGRTQMKEDEKTKETAADQKQERTGGRVANPVRRWTDKTGKYRVQAQLIDFKDGIVTLKKADGSDAKVPMERLSIVDQEYVRRLTVSRDKSPLRPAQDANPPQESKMPSNDRAARTPITLEELRKRPPVCGVPSDLRANMGRVEQLASVKEDWFQQITRMEIGASGFLTHFPKKMAILFDGNKLKHDLNTRLLRRLASMSPTEFSLWYSAILDLKYDPSLQGWHILATLSAVDELYDQTDKYDRQNGDKYLKRLKGLAREDVDLWIEKMDAKPYFEDAAIGIILIDNFFSGDQFIRNAFNAVMSE